VPVPVRPSDAVALLSHAAALPLAVVATVVAAAAPHAASAFPSRANF
jgi:bifunctional DNase/RNase